MTRTRKIVPTLHHLAKLFLTCSLLSIFGMSSLRDSWLFNRPSICLHFLSTLRPTWRRFSSNLALSVSFSSNRRCHSASLDREVDCNCSTWKAKKSQVKITVKSSYNGSKRKGNPPIMDLKVWSLHVNFFYYLFCNNENPPKMNKILSLDIRYCGVRP